MPFESEKQRRFMWANHPEIAKRWANEEKGEPKSKLADAIEDKKEPKEHKGKSMLADSL